MHPASGQFVNIHAHRTAGSPDEWVLTNIRVKDWLPELHNSAQYSAGIHPWDTEENSFSDLQKRVQKLSENSQVIAIGETGIDKAVSIPIETQVQIFRMQLDLAAEKSMPVLIHAVRANEEIIRECKPYQGRIPLVIHGFTGGRQLATSLVGAGFFLSVGETLKFSEKLKDAIPHIPQERFFLETDESDISIAELYNIASKILNIPLADLQEQMVERVTGLFNI